MPKRKNPKRERNGQQADNPKVEYPPTNNPETRDALLGKQAARDTRNPDGTPVKGRKPSGKRKGGK